ncbi:MAG: glutamate racemase [Acidimicrobiales bacterium]|nr:glutamate racemase [Acidimicrobiales bacterium]MCB9394704.1 glutamate racemase [Acidimicrobiaceae bacterium]
MDGRPIGMFDSGFGGLTVARAVIDLLPAEHLVYVGDTGRYPYGSKPQHDVAAYARQIAHHLIDTHDVKVIVVACNTAASAVDLAAELPIPVLGVIEPGARALVQATRSGQVGVIGTVGTIGSGSYQRAVADEVERVAGDRATGGGSADPDIDLVCAACPGFVEFVERGVVTGDEITVLAERLLAPVREAKVDTLLLGCTHYPYLARVIGDVMGSDVVLVSSADETAFALRSLLTDAGIARDPADGTGTHTFCSSGDVDWFRALGRRLLGPELVEARPVTFEGP